MAVLPSGLHQQGFQSSPDSSQLNSINQTGQYILVQRAGIVTGENPARASSAPPAQNQVCFFLFALVYEFGFKKY